MSGIDTYPTHNPRRVAETTAAVEALTPPDQHEELMRRIGGQAIGDVMEEITDNGPHNLEEWQKTQEAQEAIRWREQLLRNYERLAPYELGEPIGWGAESVAHTVKGKEHLVVRVSHDADAAPYSIDQRAERLMRVSHVPRVEKPVAYSLTEGHIITRRIPGNSLDGIPDEVGYMSGKHLRTAIATIVELDKAGLAIDNHTDILFERYKGFGFVDLRPDGRSLEAQLGIFAYAIKQAAVVKEIQTPNDRIDAAIGAAKAITVLEAYQKIIKEDETLNIKSDAEIFDKIEQHIKDLDTTIDVHFQEKYVAPEHETLASESDQEMADLAELMDGIGKGGDLDTLLKQL